MKLSRVLSFVLAAGLLGSAIAFNPTRDPGTWPTGLASSASTITAGTAVTMSLDVNQLGSSPTTVSITSSAPNYFPVPNSVVVSPLDGEDTLGPAKTFSAGSGGVSPSTPTYVTVTASANGHSASTVILVQ